MKNESISITRNSVPLSTMTEVGAIFVAALSAYGLKKLYSR